MSRQWRLVRSSWFWTVLLMVGRRLGVVRRQAGVGAIVLVARIEEELAAVGRGDKLARRVDVPFVDEDRIGVHSVDLHGQARRPETEVLGRPARVEEECTPRAGSRLGELLARERATLEEVWRVDGVASVSQLVSESVEPLGPAPERGERAIPRPYRLPQLSPRTSRVRRLAAEDER
jgi:hypothetical protein